MTTCVRSSSFFVGAWAGGWLACAARAQQLRARRQPLSPQAPRTPQTLILGSQRPPPPSPPPLFLRSRAGGRRLCKRRRGRRRPARAGGQRGRPAPARVKCPNNATPFAFECGFVAQSPRTLVVPFRHNQKTARKIKKNPDPAPSCPRAPWPQFAAPKPLGTRKGLSTAPRAVRAPRESPAAWAPACPRSGSPFSATSY